MKPSVKFSSRRSHSSAQVLQGAVGFTNDLVKIKTSAKQETMAELRKNTAAWLGNSHFEKYRASKIDVAIVVCVNQHRYLKQDCDNLAKVVLDAISNSRQNPKPFYLIENDSQVIRLLVYKVQRKEVPDTATDEVMVSFRPHDPNKQMILVEQGQAQLGAEAFRLKNSDSCETIATTREDGTKFIEVEANDKIELSGDVKNSV